MNETEPNPPQLRTLWMYVREGLRRANAARPVSFYLLLAIPVALLLGAHILDMRERPKEFAFYLALFFVFFFVIMHRAIMDFIDISRKHFVEQEKVFRSTLGDADFATRLGERVEERRKE